MTPAADTAGNTTTLERRRDKRYRLYLPALFKWKETTGEAFQGGGFTRDVSTNGTYVRCDEVCPPVSATISVELLLPTPEGDLLGPKLKADGSVVRTGDDGGNKGFAIAAQFALAADAPTR